jgi:nitrite reductase (NADH) small subunit
MTLLTLALPMETTRPRAAQEHEADERTQDVSEPDPRRTVEEVVTWHAVCDLDDIDPDTGVCALLGGVQIAVVRVGAGEDVFAIGNFDPFSKAFVLSRGIVGDRGGIAKIASPLYKQSFDLRTGVCLDDPSVAVPVWPARVRGGRVEVATS